MDIFPHKIMGKLRPSTCHFDKLSHHKLRNHTMQYAVLHRRLFTKPEQYAAFVMTTIHLLFTRT